MLLTTQDIRDFQVSGPGVLKLKWASSFQSYTKRRPSLCIWSSHTHMHIDFLSWQGPNFLAWSSKPTWVGLCLPGTSSFSYHTPGNIMCSRYVELTLSSSRLSPLGPFLQLPNSYLSFRAQLHFSSTLVLVICPSSVFPQLHSSKAHWFITVLSISSTKMINFWRRWTSLSPLCFWSFIAPWNICSNISKGASKKMCAIMVLWTSLLGFESKNMGLIASRPAN